MKFAVCVFRLLSTKLQPPGCVSNKFTVEASICTRCKRAVVIMSSFGDLRIWIIPRWFRRREAAGARRLCALAGSGVSETLAEEGRAMVRPCASQDNKMIALNFARTVRCAVPRARANTTRQFFTSVRV